MRNIYLTGGTGFVGRHVRERLVADGHQVVAADRRSFDLEHPESLSASSLHGLDTVVHLAARVHVARPAADENRLLWQSNVVATDALARAAVDAGVRRFVYMSSIKVHGERTRDRPFTSSDEPAPEDPYARSKLGAEDALRKLAGSRGLEVAIVRPPLVYGPCVGANFLRLLQLVARRIPLPLASVDNRRSLVSVWNLADFVATLCARQGEIRGTWLVADCSDLSTADLVRRIAAAMKLQPRLFPVPPPLVRFAGRMLGRGAEVTRLCDSLQVDASPTRQALGWKPPLTCDEGIDRTVQWYSSRSREHA